MDLVVARVHFTPFVLPSMVFPLGSICNCILPKALEASAVGH